MTALLAVALVVGAFAAPSPAQASSDTHSSTGAAGGAVNNLPPAVDNLKATPRTVVVGAGDEVRVSGIVRDDNGHWDVGSVTLKVTRPSGTSTVLAATLTPSADDVTVLSFSATHPVAAGDETGTYQVDGFATDLAGAQSPVRSATFRVVAQHNQADPIGLGADQAVYRVTNPLGPGAHLYVDVGSLACPPGAVPAVGNADILLGTLGADGGFTPTASRPYVESALDLGALGESEELLVKLHLRNVPEGGASPCAASLGVYFA